MSGQQYLTGQPAAECPDVEALTAALQQEREMRAKHGGGSDEHESANARLNEIVAKRRAGRRQHD